jgi:hypothetical protein
MQDHRQFKLRYYEFLDYHRAPNGPVFLYICGEASCSGISNNYLAVSYMATPISSGIIGHYLLHCVHCVSSCNSVSYPITYLWVGLMYT